MRLGRSRRLRKGPEFERVFKEGVAIGGPFAVFRVVPAGVDVGRWGFAAGKKQFPSAVERNRARRRLKAAVQALAPSGAFDVVAIARPAVLTAEFTAVVDSIAGQLRRAGMEIGP